MCIRDSKKSVRTKRERKNGQTHGFVGGRGNAVGLHVKTEHNLRRQKLYPDKNPRKRAINAIANCKKKVRKARNFANPFLWDYYEKKMGNSDSSELNENATVIAAVSRPHFYALIIK